MKKTNIITTISICLILLSISTLFYSCSKDNSTNTSTSSPSASGLEAGKSKISFDYSGARSGSFSSVDLTSTAIKNSSYGNLSGGVVNGTNVETFVFLQPLSQTGTISFKSLSTSSINLVTYTKGSDAWLAEAGSDFTIVITKNDGVTVEATFSGKLVNDIDNSVITVTNGKLAAKY